MKSLKWIATVLLLLNAANGFSEETVTLAIGEMPPYVSQDAEHYGFFCRIITEILSSNGLKTEYKFVPWNRAIIKTEEGYYDGTPGWYRTPERETAFYVSDPLADDTQSFFHLKTYPFEWNAIEDLKGIRIGATLGYNYGDQFSAAEKEGRILVDRVAKDETNFKKLLHKRIDIFPMNTLTGYSMLHTMFKPEIVSLFANHSKPVRSATLHLLLSRKVQRNEQLIILFNKGLRALKESGRYDEYLDEIQMIK
jgi:polar amino acid transport system substrate-binding protein